VRSTTLPASQNTRLSAPLQVDLWVSGLHGMAWQVSATQRCWALQSPSPRQPTQCEVPALALQ
jgi:hypothetical protein